MIGLRAMTPVLLLLLPSCGERPETTAYFTKVTGLPLCPGAAVRNVNAHAPDRSPGFDSIYIADISMPATCRSSFLRAVGQRIGAQCDGSNGCSGSASNGEFFGIEPRGAGFRVTHAT